MVTTRIFSNTPLTNEEKYFLQSILTKETFEHEQFFKLLTIDSPVDPALEHIEFRILFDKAILSALLDAKKNLFLFLPNERFSTYQLAESILRDLKNSSIKNELLPIIANDLKNFNKGQSRIFFLHTRKNNASYIDALPKDIKQKNLGSYFKYEKYILEIEYLLKKPNSFGTTIYNIQPIIDVYALNRIRSIKNWKNFTLDQLNELRKTYEKLRSFLVYGKQYKKKIPTYCYENYLDCIRLIYDYVKAYTPHQLLDVAYYRLENTYLFYTQCHLV